MKLLPYVLALSCLILAPRIADAGACAQPGWSPTVLTPANQSVPANGGLLVTAFQAFGLMGANGASRNQDPSVAAWTLRRGPHTLRFRVDRLAPGLSRYVPIGRAGGEWTLAGHNPKRTVRFHRGSGVRLPAPSVRSVTRGTRHWKNFRRHRSSSHYVNALVGSVPREAIGVIVYRAAAKPIPMLFKQVPATRPGQRASLALYSTPGRCSSSMPGVMVPFVGGKVQLRWVDAFGRLSPLSAPIVVTQAP